MFGASDKQFQSIVISSWYHAIMYSIGMVGRLLVIDRIYLYTYCYVDEPHQVMCAVWYDMQVLLWNITLYYIYKF